MVKCRLTFTHDKDGFAELNNTIDKIKKDFNVLNISKIYKGQGNSQYSNIYLDIIQKEHKDER